MRDGRYCGAMRVYDLNWMQLEEYLRGDDRVVLPLGSTEQHAYLSLGTDNILAERVSVEAAEPLRIPVLPVLPFGVCPSFAAYPGSPTLRVETFVAVIRDVLDSLYGQGFRRFLLVNGHGGNTAAASLALEWMGGRRDAQVLFHNWWNSPRVWEVVQSVDPVASHASWLENFPWTRLDGVELPREQKPLFTPGPNDPDTVRRLVGDGSYGGVYERSDEEMLRIWEAGVADVRALLESGWRS